MPPSKNTLPMIRSSTWRFQYFVIGDIICYPESSFSFLSIRFEIHLLLKKLNARHGRWTEFLQDYTFTLRYKAGVENKTINTLNHHIFILTKMTTTFSDFERLRIKYESYHDFYEIYTALKNGITRRVDGFILHDRVFKP